MIFPSPSHPCRLSPKHAALQDYEQTSLSFLLSFGVVVARSSRRGRKAKSRKSGTVAVEGEVGEGGGGGAVLLLVLSDEDEFYHESW